MINKRLLIKNLLAHNSESSFYDKKRQLNLHSREGKGKFLKHICALSNSNPSNNSYIVVGVEDTDNEIVGEDFYDDSHLQNLVNAFLENPPKIQYENVPFPHLPKGKVVGLVTIRPKNGLSSFKKNIYTITTGTIFIRRGSNSCPLEGTFIRNTQNKEIVLSIEKNSRNSVGHTLDGVIDFMNNRHQDMASKYKVFKELFVICWAGNPKKVKDKTYLSRVDIELINEQVKLFYSSQDEVTISYNEDCFTITEYIFLGLNDKTSYYPLEQQTIYFFENGYYKIETQMLFEPPKYSKKMLLHIYNTTLTVLLKLQNQKSLEPKEYDDVIQIPSTLMICYLNGFKEAKQKLIESKLVLKTHKNPEVYVSFKESLRILRKMKYDSQPNLL
jgi:Domain of unknown function (DUF5929)/Putative DNA-binding domain